ncbi:MAG: ArsR/SmtB family transcription factor [Candidatus Bathyarchaeia archaeon]
MIIAKELSKQRILTAIADPYSRRILVASIQNSVSALELSVECGIPITTVYRRIEELVQAGLVAAVKASRTKEGKWLELYRCLVKRIDISLENGTLFVGIVTDDKFPEKFTHKLMICNPTS